MQPWPTPSISTSPLPYNVSSLSKLEENVVKTPPNIPASTTASSLRVAAKTADAKNRRNESFQSNLSSGALRRDGITRKFSSERGYTGAGYDEFYDDDVGVQRRLLDALSELDRDGRAAAHRRERERANERLFERDGSGARTWEDRMDEHIGESRALREDLNAILREFVGEINSRLSAARDERRRRTRWGGEGVGGGGAGAVAGGALGMAAAQSSERLKLVSDDKSERLTMGLLDIARQGNAFVISNAGGSLPLGMTVQRWKKVFEPPPPPGAVSSSSSSSSKDSQTKEEVTRRGSSAMIIDAKKKRRRRVLEDSSDEEDVVALPPSKTKRLLQQQQQPTATSASEDGDDGLEVRVREATDVTKSKNSMGRSPAYAAADDDDVKTALIDEMKQRLGVDNALLERNRMLVEEEQLRSKIAADDEDAREGLFGDDVATSDGLSGGLGGGANEFSARVVVPLLKSCLAVRSTLRRNDLYWNDSELLGETQELWADFDVSLSRWKECFWELLAMMRREDVSSNGSSLDGSSDHAYSLRENFREANMFLGNNCMEINDFFVSQLHKTRRAAASSARGGNSVPAAASSSPPRSSLEESLSDICDAYLRFARVTYETALDMVSEQERCCRRRSSGANNGGVAGSWERAQHLLLRGRAHHNIGRAAYELARYCELVDGPERRRHSGNKKNENRDLLVAAKKEFDNAASRARAVRRNTVLIRGHPNAEDISTQSSYSWAMEAVIQSLEAMKLQCHSSGFRLSCSLKLGQAKEAEEGFDGFFESIELSDVLSFVGAEGVSHVEVVEALDDLYWLVMRVAELSTQSLESLLPGTKSWNLQAGEELCRHGGCIGL